MTNDEQNELALLRQENNKLRQTIEQQEIALASSNTALADITAVVAKYKTLATSHAKELVLRTRSKAAVFDRLDELFPAYVDFFKALGKTTTQITVELKVYLRNMEVTEPPEAVAELLDDACERYVIDVMKSITAKLEA